MLVGNRFSSKLDECIHIVIALIVNDVYESQKQDLVDHYGIDTVETAYSTVMNDYSGLLQRL